MKRRFWVRVGIVGIVLLGLAGGSVLGQEALAPEQPAPGNEPAKVEPAPPPGPPAPGPFGPPKSGSPEGLPGSPDRQPGMMGMPPQPSMPFGIPSSRRSRGPETGGFPFHLFGPPRWPHADWPSMEKNDPAMFKLLKEEGDLDRRTRELAMQHRLAPPAQRDQIKKELEKLVNQHFDVRQQRRQLEIKRLEEELQRLRDAIDRRNKARNEIVGRRVAELLGQEDDTTF